MGFDRTTAARFSFLLSMPIIAGAGVYKGIDLVREGIPRGCGGAFAAGVIASAISGFLVIAFLLVVPAPARLRGVPVVPARRAPRSSSGVIATGIRSATI